ncbi:hypothetical protein SLEP1_g16670 [Rubroshorea leprosula]|uniref:Secreted protein n=1 Tax=Rubroshorea leprosula TaxID=152421 RepID=A0AAV5IRK0_9ROSI|nr:hypothetical protein SLEP1_g16670 [Rubroshorea leprosula]
MLFVTLLVGEVINASTCRHVSERAGSFNPASGADGTSHFLLRGIFNILNGCPPSKLSGVASIFNSLQTTPKRLLIRTPFAPPTIASNLARFNIKVHLPVFLIPNLVM